MVLNCGWHAVTEISKDYNFAAAIVVVNCYLKVIGFMHVSIQTVACEDSKYCFQS